MPKLISTETKEVVHTVELTQDEVRLLFAACNVTERSTHSPASEGYGAMAAWLCLLMENGTTFESKER